MKTITKVLIKRQYIILVTILILVAFMRNIASVRGLYYGYDQDSDRDLGNVMNLIGGNFLNDPSYVGEYIWYNPLIFWVEGVFVKLTGLPAITLVTQIGAFLNILSPILFYIMVSYLFSSRVALASTASFLFFSSGDMQASHTATYSPWFYPVNFVQVVFYLAIIFMCRAFIRRTYLDFILAGVITGIAFLGHTAPTLILVLIFISLIAKEFYKSYRMRWIGATEILKYGFAFGLSFLVVSIPILYTIVWKYHYHTINTAPAQFMASIFYLQNIPELIKVNFSIALVVSLIGFLVFIFEKSKDEIKHRVLQVWVTSAAVLFAYTMVVPACRISFNVELLSLVPCFHFFFYLKSFQSVMFGTGLCLVVEFLASRFLKGKTGEYVKPVSVTLVVLLMSMLYYPVYSTRRDFCEQRKIALERNRLSDEIEVYNFIISHSDINDVMVCEVDYSLFPVMATGRKLVASEPHFSNPYISYEQRHFDRLKILHALYEGDTTNATDLLEKYHVKFILLENKKITHPEKLSTAYKPLFKDNKFSIFLNSPHHHL